MLCYMLWLNTSISAWLAVPFSKWKLVSRHKSLSPIIKLQPTSTSNSSAAALGWLIPSKQCSHRHSFGLYREKGTIFVKFHPAEAAPKESNVLLLLLDPLCFSLDGERLSQEELNPENIKCGWILLGRMK